LGSTANYAGTYRRIIQPDDILRPRRLQSRCDASRSDGRLYQDLALMMIVASARSLWPTSMPQDFEVEATVSHRIPVYQP